MAFDFDKLKEDIISAGKEVGDFAKGATDVARIKINIRTKEDFLQKQYAELGKAYYACTESGEEMHADACMDSIREVKAEIKRLNEELMDAQGSAVCENCGAKQAAGTNYCQNCGAPLQ